MFVPTNSSYSSCPRCQVDQYPFAQTEIAYQTGLLRQRLHDCPDDNRAGGYDFFAAFF